LLHLIIQFGNNMLVEFFETYLQQIIRAYLAQKAVLDENIRQWIESGMNLANLAESGLGGLRGFKALIELNPLLKLHKSDKADNHDA